MHEPDYHPQSSSVPNLAGVVLFKSSMGAALLEPALCLTLALLGRWSTAYWIPLLVALPVSALYAFALFITVLLGGV